jgi:hypothetical protein
MNADCCVGVTDVVLNHDGAFQGKRIFSIARKISYVGRATTGIDG